MEKLLHPARHQRGYAMLATIAVAGLFTAAAVTTHLGAEALSKDRKSTRLNSSH